MAGGVEEEGWGGGVGRKRARGGRGEGKERGGRRKNGQVNVTYVLLCPAPPSDPPQLPSPLNCSMATDPP